MSSMKSRSTKSVTQPKLSPEKLRRVLLAQAYALILSPEWNMLNKSWADLPRSNTGKNNKSDTDKASLGE
jgi:hypothetical protein